MKFTPKTQAELDADGLLPKGEYDALVLTAEEATSKKGNDMIKLKLGVFRPDGQQEWIFDYVMEAMHHKLKHFAEACGFLKEYEAGELDADDCVGKSFRVKVGIEPAKDGYAAKNKIDDYVVSEAAVARKPEADATDDDQEIPF